MIFPIWELWKQTTPRCHWNLWVLCSPRIHWGTLGRDDCHSRGLGMTGWDQQLVVFWCDHWLSISRVCPQHHHSSRFLTTWDFSQPSPLDADSVLPGNLAQPWTNPEDGYDCSQEVDTAPAQSLISSLISQFVDIWRPLSPCCHTSRVCWQEFIWKYCQH